MDLLDPPIAPPAPPAGRERQRRAAGRRTAQVARSRRSGRRHRRQRRLRTLRRGGLGLLGVVTAVALVLGAAWLVRPAPSDDAAGPAEPAVPVVADQATLLLLREDPATPGARAVTLLAASAEGASATFIPSTTLVEIPGVGMDRLGLAHQYGGAELVLATVENALGVEIDHVAHTTTDALGALLQRAGGAEVEIDQRLVDRAADGTGTVVFEAGPQYLNGVRLAEYWAFEQRGETELDTFPRQQRALGAMLTALADDDLRTTLLAEVPPELTTTADAAFLQSVLGPAAEAQADGILTYHLLPVAPFGSADDSLGASYQLRETEVDELVATTLAGSLPEGGTADPVRIQVLNGVGVPGVGQRVDEAIEGLGFRITRTDNARSFDFLETQVVIYEETEASLAAARQVQRAMGVGTILVSRQPQSVVDMTVVVGADFVPPTTPAPGP